MRTTILAKSSSGDSYRVEFLDESGGIRVFCHCQAGVLQQMCKHKLALIKLDPKMLFDQSELPSSQAIGTWPSYPALSARLAEFERDLATIERDKAAVAPAKSNSRQPLIMS